MSEYVRPAIQPAVFVDANGQDIDYGNRWGMGSPPDDTYSVTSNLERFAPLHTVAEALIAWLVETYDVVVEDGPSAVDDLVHRPHDLVRAVKLTPRIDAAAPLTFAFTSFPGVYVHAGVLFEFSAPPCGCDACDENWEHGADELEWQVQAVVQGRLTEKLRGAFRRTAHSSVEMPGIGGTSGSHRLLRKGERARASALARRVPRGGVWAPWPLREPGP